MKFFIYSISGDGAGLAYKLCAEGHDVCIFIKDKFFRPILDGMVDHVNTVQEGLLTEPDLIIFDMSGDGKLADNLRKEGWNVLGSSELADKLELDRTYGMEVAKEAGILVPDYTVFQAKDVDEAIKFVGDSKGRYVLKPHGNSSLEMTYVAKDPDDMIKMLEWAKKKNIIKDDFLLQDFVDGIEISTEMWFSHGEPIASLANGTIEQKKFMTGNKGPATGCESSVVWPYHSDSAKIVESTVGRLYYFLENYHGPIDINAIVSKKDGEAYFLEFTPRLGYSAFYTFCELLPKENVGLFLKQLNDAKDLELDGGVAECITVSIPPYPLDSGKEHNHQELRTTEGKKLLELPEKGFWPYDIKLQDDEIITAGTLALVGYFSIWGNTVFEANKKLYEMLDEIVIPNVQFRIDAEERAIKDIPELKKMGYEVPSLGREE